MFGWFGSKPKVAKKVECGIYREPASQVHMSGSSVIQDNGMLVPAYMAAGRFLFSEAGAGVKPLVLLGLKNEVMVWLDKWASTSIENRISELPQIYMGVEPYRPGARFKGLFPVADTVNAITGALGAFAPGGVITDLAGSLGDIKGAWDLTRGGGATDIYSQSRIEKVDYQGVIYVRFHYLPSEKMAQIGTRSVSFRDVKAVLQTMLR